jgi:hypothetical protein
MPLDGALLGKNGSMSIHRQNVTVKNVDGKEKVVRQNVEWDKRLTKKTSNSKKYQKDKTLNSK